MISIYTDEARRKRYADNLRIKAKCEKWFAISLGIYVLLMIAELCGGFFSRGMAIGLGVNNIAQIGRYHLLPCFLALSAGLAGILLREWRLTAAAVIGVLLVTCAGWFNAFCIGTFTLLPLASATAAGIKWAKLRKEEGFPRFQIDWAEYETREKSQTGYVQQRALEQGVRTEPQPLDPHAGMRDLTEKPETEALPAVLQGYHDRGIGSDPVVQAPVSHYDRMATIKPEDVGGLEQL